MSAMQQPAFCFFLLNSLKSKLRVPWPMVLALCIILWGSHGSASAEVIRIDGFEAGGFASFQAGFVTGETAAVRLVPLSAGDHDLTEVHFLLGGSTSVVTVTLKIWQDIGIDAPGSLIFSGDYQVTGSDNAFQSIDLSGDNVVVNGAFRVGLTMQHSGYPGPARDGDGINAALNFIDANGFGWVKSSLLGLTGDWIIRATVASASAATYTVGGSVVGLVGNVTLSHNIADIQVVTTDGAYTFAQPLSDGAAYSVQVDSEPVGQDCLVAQGSGTISGADVTGVVVTCVDQATVRSNDGWFAGLNAAFQLGFVANETAAVRLDPGGSGVHRVTAIHFLFGGLPTSQQVQVRIWDDAAGANEPGVELFSGSFLITGQLAAQGLDLSSYDIQVAGPYRVGLTFSHSGLPSVARDDDGTNTSGRNSILSGGVWTDSALLGVTGDWIIRAVDEPISVPATLAITAVSDLPNDQGRQVRVAWLADGRDAPGAMPAITGYAVFRQIAPGFAAQGGVPDGMSKAYPPGDWDYLATIPAFQEANYNAILPTVADSTIAAGMHYSVFFVRAMTDNVGVFYDSAPDSGYSLDNLAPATPENVQIVWASGAGNNLSWLEAVDPDFNHFKIYRGSVPDFAVDPLALVHTSITPSWQDVFGDEASYYRLSSVDFAGNESPPSSALAVSAASGMQPVAAFLGQNYPNPFNPSTRIEYFLPQTDLVQLRIFDSRGRSVRTLVSGNVSAGNQTVLWAGEDDRGQRLSSGVYFYQLLVGGQEVLTRRMTLVK